MNMRNYLFLNIRKSIIGTDPAYQSIHKTGGCMFFTTNTPINIKNQLIKAEVYCYLSPRVVDPKKDTKKIWDKLSQSTMVKTLKMLS